MLLNGIPAKYLILFIVIIAAIIFFLIWDVLIWRRLFIKAGEKGWKAFVPIYNTITTIKILGNSRETLIIYFALLGGSVVASISKLPYLSAALSIFYMILNFQMARHFGQSTKYAIGALLFWPAFGGILAFSNAEVTAYDQNQINQLPVAPFSPNQQSDPVAPVQPAAPFSAPPTSSSSNQPVQTNPAQPNQPPSAPTV